MFFGSIIQYIFSGLSDLIPVHIASQPTKLLLLLQDTLMITIQTIQSGRVHTVILQQQKKRVLNIM
jgi:hypothetical protein